MSPSVARSKAGSNAAAQSLQAFGLYLCITAAGLLLAPGLLPALLLFAAVDIAAALWTAMAMRRLSVARLQPT